MPKFLALVVAAIGIASAFFGLSQGGVAMLVMGVFMPPAMFIVFGVALAVVGAAMLRR